MSRTSTFWAKAFVYIFQVVVSFSIRSSAAVIMATVSDNQFTLYNNYSETRNLIGQ
jgi:hypothetical protein